MDNTTYHGPMPCGRIDPATGVPCSITPLRLTASTDLYRLIESLYGPRACPAHATEADAALAKVLDKTWIDAYLVGRAQGEINGLAIAKATAAPQNRAEAATGTMRARDDRGRQLVLVTKEYSPHLPGVNKKYTYHWADPHGQGDLAVGDQVLLPPNEVEPTIHIAVISDLGSDYAGATKAISALHSRSTPTAT